MTLLALDSQKPHLSLKLGFQQIENPHLSKGNMLEDVVKGLKGVLVGYPAVKKFLKLKWEQSGALVNVNILGIGARRMP